MSSNIATRSWNSMIPSTGSLFSAYASASATLTLVQQAYTKFIPPPLRDRLEDIFSGLLQRRRATSKFTLIVEEYEGVKRNPLFEALEVYLCDKVLTTSASCLKVSTDSDIGRSDGCPLSLKLARKEDFVEVFDGVEISWKFHYLDPNVGTNENRVRFFHLCFVQAHKDHVLNSYIPQVLRTADTIMRKDKVLKIWTLKYSGFSDFCSDNEIGMWQSVKLKHPSTFETLALAPDLKRAIMDDLNLFLERKEFYREVGRAWKRGYLLYGPPGTGKSSLIAAFANYLKFDVFDLQLMHIRGDDMLRKLLLSTTNRSILVIEDIDCCMGLSKKRKRRDDEDESDSEDEEDEIQKKKNYAGYPGKISLSGLLNFIDELWSSCGDERIIIFTANHKERIDPALLRPGRMDMHIHMSYLDMDAFKMLTSKYLGIVVDSPPHRLLGEINDMMQTTEVTVGITCFTSDRISIVMRLYKSEEEINTNCV